MKKNKIDINKEVVLKIEQYKNTMDSEEKNAILTEIFKMLKPLIHYTINMMKYKEPITREELETICCTRIWEIVEKYQKCENLAFTSYIVTDIKFTMINYIRETQRAIKIPHGVLKKNAKIREIEEDAMKIKRRKPTDEELIGFGFKKEEIERYKETTALDDIAVINEETESCTIEDYVELEGFDNEKLEVAYNKLNENDRKILDEIVIEGKSYSDVAREQGCTRQNIQTKYKKIIKKLKEEL